MLCFSFYNEHAEVISVLLQGYFLAISLGRLISTQFFMFMLRILIRSQRFTFIDKQNLKFNINITALDFNQLLLKCYPYFTCVQNIIICKGYKDKYFVIRSFTDRGKPVHFTVYWGAYVVNTNVRQYLTSISINAEETMKYALQ